MVPEGDGTERLPFSILGRIEPTATGSPGSGLVGHAALSVSSVGSSPLQRCPSHSQVTGGCLSVSSVGSSPLQQHLDGPRDGELRTFQYPRSDRAHCNMGEESFPHRARKTFQYPRSDRAHCNSVWTSGACSVPSSLSILGRIEPAATVWIRSVWRVRKGPFSILGRIEPTATFPPETRTTPTPTGFQYPRSDRAHCNRRVSRPRLSEERLSVSSVGSSPLQRAWYDPLGGYWCDFQYPRSDRAHCNAGRSGWGRRRRALSVSSVGSSPLQRGRVGEYGSERQAFSILGRIEPTATPGRHAAGHPGGHPFSILGRIEPTATPQISEGISPPPNQLSVSSVGSSPLQPPRAPRSRWPGQAFSILGRIEPTATKVVEGKKVVIVAFQYPRSDRAHCNIFRPAKSLR